VCFCSPSGVGASTGLLT